MKNYVIAMYQEVTEESLINLCGIKAESPYEAVKKANLEFIWNKYKQTEIDFQNSEDYPKTIDELQEHLLENCNIKFSVIEVGSLI
jgi:hypothetical protein